MCGLPNTTSPRSPTRDVAPGVVDDAHVHREPGAPGRGQQPLLAGERAGVVVLAQHRPDRRHLGHPVELSEDRTEALQQLEHALRRYRRGAVPDRRQRRDVLAGDPGLQDSEQHGRDEVGVGRARAAHLRRERNGIEATAVLETGGASDDKQRKQRDLHARVVRERHQPARVLVELVLERRNQRVMQYRLVVEQHTLRPSRGAARVDDAEVVLWPHVVNLGRERARRAGEQRLIPVGSIVVEHHDGDAEALRQTTCELAELRLGDE